MDFSEEFLAGWAAARVHWQHSGSVTPHPPGWEPPQPEAPKVDPLTPVAAGAPLEVEVEIAKEDS